MGCISLKFIRAAPILVIAHPAPANRGQAVRTDIAISVAASSSLNAYFLLTFSSASLSQPFNNVYQLIF